MITSHSPLIPYQIITQSKFNDVINKVLELIHYPMCGYIDPFDKINNAFGYPSRFQNCVNTVYALSMILLGVETTKKMASTLALTGTIYFKVPLPSGKTWHYQVVGLFDGNISHDISINDEFDDYDTLKKVVVDFEYKKPYLVKFKETLQPLINAAKCASDKRTIEAIKERFSTLKYPFNKATLELLQNDIFERNNIVNEKSTFIYVLFVYNSSSLDDTPVEHAWVIEQFFNKATQEAAFRLYQSWAGGATLMSDLSRRGDTPWNLDKLKQFLLSLKTLCCSFKENDSLLQCFGYTASTPPLLQFDGNTFSGRFLYYRIFEIDPKQCLNNYQELFK